MYVNITKQVFEARLRVAFHGVPGEEWVRDKQYRVLTRDNQIVKPKHWTDLVSPRSTLIMFVLVGEVMVEDTNCPQPACRARDTQSKTVRDEGMMVTWYVLP